MKCFRHRVIFPALAVSAGLLAACATTSIQSVNETPDFQSSKIHKVMVVGLMRTPALRKTFENEFVRQWKEYGVNAVSSLEVLPANVELNKAGVAVAAKAQGFDTVAVTRLVGRQEAEAQFPNPGSKDQPTSPEESQSLTEHLNVVIASPEYGADYQVALVRTNIYDASTEKRLWSGMTQTVVTGDVPKLIKPFVKIILKNLYKKP